MSTPSLTCRTETIQRAVAPSAPNSVMGSPGDAVSSSETAMMDISPVILRSHLATFFACSVSTQTTIPGVWLYRAKSHELFVAVAENICTEPLTEHAAPQAARHIFFRKIVARAETDVCYALEPKLSDSVVGFESQVSDGRWSPRQRLRPVKPLLDFESACCSIRCIIAGRPMPC
jgi:hypothetical protein